MGTGSGRGPGWAERTFGESAGELARLIPAGLVRAHDRARSTHEGVRTQTLEAYGHGLYAAQFEEPALPAPAGCPTGSCETTRPPRAPTVTSTWTRGCSTPPRPGRRRYADRGRASCRGSFPGTCAAAPDGTAVRHADPTLR
ncbi:hypothetical protein Shyd_90720 [Streptomyces hydrogenans]|uniref:Uncharacterized protein n=1 Tax=Streptomyces hydrogenans TaxID=1873719 RepID=A0ABQ3PRQ6_9ACTN|nr:hypothetical protein GCM10018784_55090 [Streptomyces hydrogenans]GHI27701.1 hypothetical protein Shyd_90720 [Streptomyces hydrogenans]